jgi:hypothetical protein
VLHGLMLLIAFSLDLSGGFVATAGAHCRWHAMGAGPMPHVHQAAGMRDHAVSSAVLPYETDRVGVGPQHESPIAVLGAPHRCPHCPAQSCPTQAPCAASAAPVAIVPPVHLAIDGRVSTTSPLRSVAAARSTSVEPPTQPPQVL